MSIPSRISPMGVPAYYRKRLNYLAEARIGQYIDTEYVFDSVRKGSALEIKLYLPGNVTNSNISFGSRRTAAGADSIYIIGRNLVAGDTLGGTAFSGVIPVDQDTVLRFSGGKYSIDGGTEVDTGKVPATQYPFGLFAFNSAGAFVPSFSAPVGTRIYYCRFFENGTLVRSFIPVLDRYGVPCMFDSVTRKRFYNAGSGLFDYA